MAFSDHDRAAEIIASIEENPRFRVLIEVSILAPYRRWAAEQHQVEAFALAPQFVAMAAQEAARRAVSSFISIKLPDGPERIRVHAQLARELAEKMQAAALGVIDREAQRGPADDGARRGSSHQAVSRA